MLTGKHYIAGMQTDVTIISPDLIRIEPTTALPRYRWICASYQSAAASAQRAADENRRPTFVIPQTMWTPCGYRPMWLMADMLDEAEFTAFMHEQGDIEQFTPTPGLNERYCESCGQIVVKTTLGGRSRDAVTYMSRNSTLAPYAPHWSWRSMHTPENCHAWTLFFVRERRAAVIGYDGAE